MGQPKLLLMDDCGLDESLLRLAREAASCPILFVTADLDLCCAADELVLLDAGRIVQRGAPAAVLDRPESLEAARVLGIPNLFQGTIAALDPGRGSSRLEFDGFALNAPYIPGHFRGDRIWIAIRPEDVRVHTAGGFLPVELVRSTRRSRAVRMEFSHGICADVSAAAFAGWKDNKTWQVEIPPQALRIL
jgi:ABC-type Fe3+/spermidine/putrescine transport system ATPase subunit